LVIASVTLRSYLATDDFAVDNLLRVEDLDGFLGGLEYEHCLTG
jgi:hypothetical protein